MSKLWGSDISLTSATLRLSYHSSSHHVTTSGVTGSKTSTSRPCFWFDGQAMWVSSLYTTNVTFFEDSVDRLVYRAIYLQILILPLLALQHRHLWNATLEQEAPHTLVPFQPRHFLRFSWDFVENHHMLELKMANKEDSDQACWTSDRKHWTYAMQHDHNMYGFDLYKYGRLSSRTVCP